MLLLAFALALPTITEPFSLLSAFSETSEQLRPLQIQPPEAASAAQRRAEIESPKLAKDDPGIKACCGEALRDTVRETAKEAMEVGWPAAAVGAAICDRHIWAGCGYNGSGEAPGWRDEP